MWLDLLLLLVVVFPLLSWSAIRVRRSAEPLKDVSGLSPNLPRLEAQEAPGDRPHQSPGP